jgi:hypothetical protein
MQQPQRSCSVPCLHIRHQCITEALVGLEVAHVQDGLAACRRDGLAADELRVGPWLERLRVASAPAVRAVQRASITGATRQAGGACKVHARG